MTPQKDLLISTIRYTSISIKHLPPSFVESLETENEFQAFREGSFELVWDRSLELSIIPKKYLAINAEDPSLEPLGLLPLILWGRKHRLTTISFLGTYVVPELPIFPEVL